MISLLPVGSIIRYIALLYASIVALFLVVASALGAQESSWWSNARTALYGAAAVEIVLMLWLYVGWRRLWLWFPELNRWLFPDINGEWIMEIHWCWKGKSGCIADATAVVKQDFMRASMEVKSSNSQ